MASSCCASPRERSVAWGPRSARYRPRSWREPSLRIGSACWRSRGSHASNRMGERWDCTEKTLKSSRRSALRGEERPPPEPTLTIHSRLTALHPGISFDGGSMPRRVLAILLAAAFIGGVSFSGASPARAQSGSDTLTVSQGVDADTLDPISTAVTPTDNLLDQIFDGLLAHDAHGKLLPAFITVSNIESREPAKVREGNERVVRARLSDAAFFWEQDRREPLAARRAGLDAVTFQAKLGSLGDKTRRLAALAGDIAIAIGGDLTLAQRAAEL
ncbi:MAG: glycine--tRNA ligase subunit beta, partial [bacterium]|nr:glycine--tRNA ligase subunit beta [bacterium]